MRINSARSRTTRSASTASKTKTSRTRTNKIFISKTHTNKTSISKTMVATSMDIIIMTMAGRTMSQSHQQLISFSITRGDSRVWGVDGSLCLQLREETVMVQDQEGKLDHSILDEVFSSMSLRAWVKITVRISYQGLICPKISRTNGTKTWTPEWSK